MNIKSVFKELRLRVKEANTKSQLDYLKKRGDSYTKQYSQPFLDPKLKNQAKRENLKLKRSIQKKSVRVK